MDASEWDERYDGAELVWSAKPNQFVASELADLRPGRALDLACGEGRNARWLAEHGWRVTAIDFSSVAIDKGSRLSDAVDWQVGDVLTAPLPHDLDLVVVAYLQIRADERGTLLRRAVDALDTGGTLLVVAHDSTNLTQGSGGPQDPSVLFTAEDVLADLADYPVEVLRAERVARVVGARDEHGAQGTAWDALVRLRRSEDGPS